ncbi:MAG: hypothetical protein M1838_001845 [Thelocarpon superellum]|nr:MAG: hypothetical protein M1838_001845 [Thelocarpon superellum]
MEAPHTPRTRSRRRSNSSNTEPSCGSESVAFKAMGESKTPASRTRGKRVRFSDVEPDPLPSWSTGLTPAVRRHTLSPVAPSRKAVTSATPGRRRSMPPSLSELQDAPSGNVHFAPLTQVLDGRIKRRLKRNHLSEELNEIHVQKRRGKWRTVAEIEALRQEIADKDKEVHDLKHQLDEHDHERRLDLEREVARLTEQMTRHDHELDEETMHETPFVGLDEDDDIDANLTDIRDATSPHHQLATTEAEVEVTSEAAVPSSVGIQTRDDPETAKLEEQVEELKDAVHQLLAEQEVLESTQQRVMSKLAPFVSSPSSQNEDDDVTELDLALDSVITELALAQSELQEAHAAMNLVTAEISSLGFEGTTAEEMVETIHKQFRRTRIELEYLNPGEHKEGFDNCRLLAMLINRIKDLMVRVDQGNKERKAAKAKESKVQERIDDARALQFNAEKRALAAEQHWIQCNAKERAALNTVKELVAESDERDRSVEKLQRALEGYRKEVKGLEKLVVRLEEESRTKTQQLQRQKDEAVADLEGQLEAEAMATRDLGNALQAKTDVIKALEGKVGLARKYAEDVEEQARSLLKERDVAVDGLRKEIASGIRSHEATIGVKNQDISSKNQEIDAKTQEISAKNQEIEALQARVTELGASLATATAAINALTSTQTTLQARLHAETEAGANAVQSMQSELMRSLARVGEIKNGFLNGRAGAGEGGTIFPATPQSMRFFGTPVKKRRRFDSGIGVLEEDEEEALEG